MDIQQAKSNKKALDEKPLSFSHPMLFFCCFFHSLFIQSKEMVISCLIATYFRLTNQTIHKEFTLKLITYLRLLEQNQFPA